MRRQRTPDKFRHPMSKFINEKRCFLWSAFALSLTIVFPTAQLLPSRTTVELSQLQGHWEGAGAGGKCSITITDNVLHYRAGTNWWKTTFKLPPGTDPQQLHATIEENFPPSKDAIGQAVNAIIKIENDTLTLATYGEDPPKTFADATEPNLYILKKVPPQKNCAEPPNKPKTP